MTIVKMPASLRIVRTDDAVAVTQPRGSALQQDVPYITGLVHSRIQRKHLCCLAVLSRQGDRQGH